MTASGASLDRRRLRTGALGAAGVGLAIAALSAGPLAGFASLPVVGALAAQAWWSRSDRGPKESAGQVGAGILGLLFAPGLLLLGGLIPAVACAAAGLLATGVGLSRQEAGMWPEGIPRPSRVSPSAFAARAVDEGMRSLVQAQGSLRRDLPVARVASDLRSATERYRAQKILDDPARAHPMPPALEKAELLPRTLAGLGDALELRFESEFEPDDPEIRASYLAKQANRHAQVLLSTQSGESGEPRPVLVCVHGYGMGRPALDARMFEAARLRRELGLDLALFTLPLHGARASGRRSGAGFLDGHPLATNAALGQSIWDLRRLIGWLRARGAPAVGVYGLSLGGYVAALLASLDRRLAAAILSVPVASLSDLRIRDLAPAERAAQEADGLTRAVLEDAFSPHAVLRHEPRVAREGRLLVASALDRICPPDQALALWEHWDRPAIHWQPGGHLLPLGGARRRAVVDRHLRDRLIAAATAPQILTRFRR